MKSAEAAAIAETVMQYEEDNIQRIIEAEIMARPFWERMMIDEICKQYQGVWLYADRKYAYILKKRHFKIERREAPNE